MANWQTFGVSLKTDEWQSIDSAAKDRGKTRHGLIADLLRKTFVNENTPIVQK
jgi:metal-responsive CopG/Arc/MetJ family transcriptional regulator